MIIIKGYVLKNSNGEYLSTNGETTNDWFKASKFDEKGIKLSEVYLKCGYELVSFEIKENKVLNCSNKCYSEIKVSIDNSGIKGKCVNCDDLVYNYSSY